MTQAWRVPLGAAGGEEQVSVDREEIDRWLRERGARLEAWTPRVPVAPGAPAEQVLSAYAEDIERIRAEGDFPTVDVISLHPEHPQAASLRARFLDEHTHAEPEVRFFVAGQGLFCLRFPDCVLQVLCVAGDLLFVPAETRHWFDCGPRPSFVALRWIGDASGWTPHFTGDPIARSLPDLEGRCGSS
jgi:1,2-dihydroxy-3-keto-5-methylthiopentene dioxygenase